ncbi:MAG: hypothetical protein A2034_02870 [Elusimicrobia bacterium GWA2_38_7]|nr:MAG: hypothetical protein A2034_02870 [Elusimicrobia bacterium GWA2_38_7]
MLVPNEIKGKIQVANFASLPQHTRARGGPATIPFGISRRPVPKRVRFSGSRKKIIETCNEMLQIVEVWPNSLKFQMELTKSFRIFANILAKSPDY